MNSKRLRVALLLLGVVALLAILWQFVRFEEPAYAGKSVSVWFKEYAYYTNAPATVPPQLIASAIKGNVRIALFASNGVLITVSSPTNLASTRLWSTTGQAPNPALEALKALGTKAVPCLVRHLRYGVLDRVYETAVTNLPAFVQRKLPSPSEKRWLRVRALQTLALLKDSARGATPALLDLLRKPEPLLRPQVLATLRGIYADREAISGLLLQLGAEKRYAEVLEIASETRWEGPAMAQLLGEILLSPDTTLHRDAIKLLEAMGEGAAPALKAILAVIDSPDGEVRYLAARTLASFLSRKRAASHPQIEKALHTRLQDENDMVRKVALRALAQERGSLP